MVSRGPDGVYGSGVIDVVASTRTAVGVFQIWWTRDFQAEALYRWRIMWMELEAGGAQQWCT